MPPPQQPEVRGSGPPVGRGQAASSLARQKVHSRCQGSNSVLFCSIPPAATAYVTRLSPPQAPLHGRGRLLPRVLDGLHP